MKYKPLTHDEHLALAAKFLKADQLLHEVAMTVAKHYPLNSRVQKLAWKASDVVHVHLKSALDSEYHKVTTDKQFANAGHAYYGSLPSITVGEDEATDAEVTLRIIKKRIIEDYARAQWHFNHAYDAMSRIVALEAMTALQGVAVATSLFDDAPLDSYITEGSAH